MTRHEGCIISASEIELFRLWNKYYYEMIDFNEYLYRMISRGVKITAWTSTERKNKYESCKAKCKND